jgi:hypothetical protein
MFDFYRIFYQMGYLEKQDVHDAAQWGVITLQDYKTITNEEYATQ